MQVGENAEYLLEPPHSAEATPPVPSTSVQILPVGSLSPQNMERLALRLVEKEGVVEYAGIYGVPGQKQDGIDVVLRVSDGKYRVIQSRRIKEVTAAGLRGAVTDFLNGKWAKKTSSFVYATSASAADTKVQDEIGVQAARLTSNGISFDVWDDDKISRKLKSHADLVEDFFGVDVLRAFLPDQASPFLAQQMVDELTPQLVQQLNPQFAAVIQSEFRSLGAGVREPPQPDAAEGLLDMVLVSGEIAPDIREVLEELRGTSRTEAQQLASYVRDDPRRARDLIREPQPWVERASWQLHNALGLLAQAAGYYADAEKAFIDAQARSPASERPLLLIRARNAAENDERLDDAEKLFQRARALNDQLIAVRIVEILKVEGLQDRLDELNWLHPVTDRERDAVDGARIDVLLELDRPQDALPLLDEMLERKPDSLFALDRRAGVAFRRATGVLTKRADRDPVALAQAAEDSLLLRELVLARARTLEAGRLLARAAECLALAGNRDGARAVLDRVTCAELEHHEVRTGLAQALLHAGRLEAARAMLGDEAEWNDDDRLVAAHTFAVGDDHDEHLRALAIARPLLGDEARRLSAALAMAIAAAFDVVIPWPEDSADALIAAAPAAIAHLRAERLSREGRHGEAERLLQEHASDPDILRALVERALEAENWGRGLTLAERLVRETARGEDRMLLAGALKGAGKKDRLKRELNAIIASANQAAGVRGRAYAALSAELPPNDYAALDDLTERWIRDLPDDRLGLWQRVFVLARLARYEQARTIIERKQLTAPTINHARLMAATYVRALKPLEAARRIARLSDQFDREDEGLEALLVFTAARTREEPDEDLKARVAETFQTFTERFPESTAIRSFSVDDNDPESLLEVIRSQFDAEHQRQRREMLDDVVNGNAPLAYLATMASRHMPQIMLRLPQVPLAYGHREEWARELELARDAIGNPAVWDPASLTIVASMPEILRAAVIDALPGSVVAYSSLLECDQAEGALDDRDEEQSILPEGDGFRISVVAQEELRRERAVVKGAFDLARTLTVAANVAEDEPDELDAFFENHNDDERNTAFDTFPATFSVARRRGLPIYSDDRYIRQMAHQSRIETFGSVACVAVLVGRQAIDEEALVEFRRELLRHGAVGLRPTGAELAALSSEHDDQPVGSWMAALLDPSGWRNDSDEHLRQCVVFLGHVWERRPDLLGDGRHAYSNALDASFRSTSSSSRAWRWFTSGSSSTSSTTTRRSSVPSPQL